jgi:hypothetical protein
MRAIIGRRELGAQLFGAECLKAAALLLAFAASSARADQLDAGKRLYHELDYDAARVALLRAAALTDPHRRAEAYLYLGLIDTVEGDDVAARRSFRNGLVLDPGLELPLGTSPKVARIFQRVKAEIVRMNAERAPLPPPPPPRPTAALPPPPAPPTVLQANPVPAEGGNEVAVPAPEATRSHTGRWVAGALVVLGLAAVGTGIYYGGQESAAEKGFQSVANQRAAPPFQSRANQDAAIADILYGAGAVVGLTGIGLWFAF